MGHRRASGTAGISTALMVALGAGAALAQRDAGALIDLVAGPMRAVELKRGPKTSTLRVSRKRGEHVPSVGASMFVVRAFYDVALSRGRTHFIKLEEREDKDGTRLYVVGFANGTPTDLAKEFGAELPAAASPATDADWFSVAEYRSIFDSAARGP